MYKPQTNNVISDLKLIRNVGYTQPLAISNWFSDENVDSISKKITELTFGVIENRPIIVPKTNITTVMSEVYSNYKYPIGDMYSRYTIPSDLPNSIFTDLTNQVIEIFVSNIRTQYGMEQANSELSIWTTVLGDFNQHNLRSHPPLKIRNKKVRSMFFFENY